MAKTTGTINIKSIEFNANSNTTEIIWNLGAEAVKEERNEEKSRIMKRAWRRARKAAEKFGGSARDYMSGTMSSAWKSERRLASKDVKTKLQGNKVTELQKAINIKEAESVEVDDTSDVTGMLKATMQIDQLEQVLRDAMIYGDENDKSGSALEKKNAEKLLEFIEDLREEYGAPEGDIKIIENLNSNNVSISAMKQWLSELTRAHYDDRYAKWAGGTEKFKDELRKISKVFTNMDGASGLLDLFDFN